MTDTKPYILISLILLTVQFLFWNGVDFIKKDIWSGTRSKKVELEVVPAAPSEDILKAFSLGDEHTAFRYYGYKLQFVGDTFGRVTPLKNYDYSKLYKWWSVLDSIEPNSDLIAHMVAYYFSATQTPKKQIPYVVKFLEEHSDKNPSKNWWWYSQAVYNAQFRAKDNESSLRIAKKLSDLPKDLDIPIWTRQLQAFIYEDKGEYQQACDIIINVLKGFGEKKLNEGELNFMHYFITERIGAMIKAEKAKGKIEVSGECKALMDVKKASDMNKI